MERVRVALVDDHRIVRRGLRSFLEAFPGIVIVGEVSSGEEMLATLELWLPDIALMDLMMPGGLDGIETTRRIRTIAPRIQVVVLTASTNDSQVLAALRAGAIEYVRKESDPEMLLQAVRAAVRDQSMLDPAVAHYVIQGLVHTAKLDDDLTPREQEILKLLAEGGTNRKIADQLVVGEETIKTPVVGNANNLMPEQWGDLCQPLHCIAYARLS